MEHIGCAQLEISQIQMLTSFKGGKRVELFTETCLLRFTL